MTGPWSPYESTLDFLDLPHSLRIPTWREARVVGELAQAVRARPDAITQSPQDVLVVQGFLDDGLGVSALVRWLERAGHRVQRADIGRNVACAQVMAERLEAELVRAAGVAGGHVVLVGHSRGGLLARVVAVRRPDLVRGVIALGSPLAGPFDVAISLKLVKLGMRGLSRLGVAGLVGECAFGTCCADLHADLQAPMPRTVSLVSIHSSSDGFVASTASTDAWADSITLDTSHLGLVLATEALEAVSASLERMATGARAA